MQIWMEGYIATGERATAQLIATVNAPTFDAAMEIYMRQHPNEVDVSQSVNGKQYTIWGCRLFPNERDTRKSFG